jgi:hypothetical protein
MDVSKLLGDQTKQLVELIVKVFATLGAIVTAVDKVGTYLQNRSLPAKQKDELLRISRSLSLLRGLSSPLGVSDDRLTDLKRQLHEMLSTSSRSLALVNALITEQVDNPDNQLSFVQRALMLYRPLGVRGWIAHVLGWIFLVFIPMYVFGLGIVTDHFQIEQFKESLKGTDNYLGFGTVIFMYVIFNRWSLAERRWRIRKAVGAKPKQPGEWAKAFLFLRPRSGRMFLAQFFFVTYSLLGIGFTTMVFMVLAGFDPEELGSGPPIKLSIGAAGFVLLAFVCRKWASDERTYGNAIPRDPLLAVFRPKINVSMIRFIWGSLLSYALCIAWTVVVMTDACGFIVEGSTLPHYLKVVFTSPVGLLVVFMVVVPLYASHRRVRLLVAAYPQTDSKEAP